MQNRLMAPVFTAVLLAGLANVAAAQNAAHSVSDTDKAFMQNAAADGIAEVQMGQMAENKSSDPKIKAYAQQIVTDHTKANDQLKAIALAKQVKVPTDPTSDAAKETKRLDGLKGKDFDTAWSKDMLSGHEKAVALFTKESKKGTDSDVRQFATTTLPTLKSHLKTAEDLNMPAARDAAMGANQGTMSDMPMATPTMTTTTTPATPAVPAAAAPATTNTSTTTTSTSAGKH